MAPTSREGNVADYDAAVFLWARFLRRGPINIIDRAKGKIFLFEF